MSTTPAPSTDPSGAGPPTAPSPTAMDDLERFEEIVSTSVTRVQESAEKWRTGIASFVTILTAALILQGPDKAADLVVRWRLLLSLTLGAALLLIVVALWQALTAAAGTPQASDLDTIRKKYGAVRTFEVVQARRAASRLLWARRSTLAGLVLLLGAIFIWWWAPAESETTYLNVTHSGTTVCGQVDGAAGGQLTLEVEGRTAPLTIEFSEVEDLAAVTTCP